jgi:hypothetical protein
LSRAEIEEKFRRLTEYGKAATGDEIDRLLPRLRAIAQAPRLARFWE